MGPILGGPWVPWDPLGGPWALLGRDRGHGAKQAQGIGLTIFPTFPNPIVWLDLIVKQSPRIFGGWTWNDKTESIQPAQFSAWMAQTFVSL